MSLRSLALAVLFEGTAGLAVGLYAQASEVEARGLADVRPQNAAIADVAPPETREILKQTDEEPTTIRLPDPLDLPPLPVVEQEPLPIPPLIEYSAVPEASAPDLKAPEDWLVRLSRPQPREKPPEPQPPVQDPARPRDARDNKPTPMPGFNELPPYPRHAVRLGQEGSVRLKLKIDTEGKVVSIRILWSTCSELLERAACKALEQWRFQGGPGIYRRTITFRLR